MAVRTTLSQKRPKTFSEILGNEHVVARLEQQLRNGVFPGLCLFHGHSGAGKTSVAEILARIYFCEKSNDGTAGLTEPCGQCPNCQRNLNIYWYHQHTGAQLSTDWQWWRVHGRDLLFQKSRFFVLDEAQDLTPRLQAWFRTDLEDASAVVVATTTHIDKIDHALLNRFTGNVYELTRPSPEQVKAFLEARCADLGVQGTPEQFLRIAQSRGCDMRHFAEFPALVKAQTPDGVITDKFLRQALPQPASLPATQTARRSTGSHEEKI
jgi:DNA polymerase-3 subunit gamma/tau